jgi:competence CoiA-like predicted nuclease
VVKCTYEYFESETEVHIESKITLRNRLKELYPNSYVAIEYKIEDTQQISDVIVIHEDGEKWAFEIQCKRLPLDILMKRSNLYRAAGVQDFWLLNYNFENYFRDFVSNENKDHQANLRVKLYSIFKSQDIEIKINNFYAAKLEEIIIKKDKDKYKIEGINSPLILEWDGTKIK